MARQTWMKINSSPGLIGASSETCSVSPVNERWIALKGGSRGVCVCCDAHIPRLVAEFEQGPLARHTPCRPAGVRPLVAALVEVHVELVLIHPFREGNGRAARLLAVLMGLQAGLPALYFDKFSCQKREEYFAAVRAGLDRNYSPMEKLFSVVIERTLQIHGASSGERT